MARLVCACALGVMIGVVAGAAKQSHGQEIDGVLACQRPEPDQPAVCGDPKAIAEATALHEQVPELAISDLVGAANSVGVSPIKYALSMGDITAPSGPSPMRPQPPASGFGPNVDARAWCVEGIESSHGRAMYNPIPVGRQHAQGWMGWLPSTAASVGVRIGDRASEWAGFRRMLAAGRGGEFFGVRAGIC